MSLATLLSKPHFFSRTFFVSFNLNLKEKWLILDILILTCVNFYTLFLLNIKAKKSREVKFIIITSQNPNPLPRIDHPFPIKPSLQKNSSPPPPSFRKIFEMRLPHPLVSEGIETMKSTTTKIPKHKVLTTCFYFI